jgi:hypothetical protein
MGKIQLPHHHGSRYHNQWDENENKTKVAGKGCNLKNKMRNKK